MADKTDKKPVKHKAVVVVHCGCILNDLPWGACGAWREEQKRKGYIIPSCSCCKDGKCYNSDVLDQLGVRGK